MNDGIIARPSGPLTGTTPAPPSKSVTHRAGFIALLARGGVVERPLRSADTLATFATLEAFGASTTHHDDHVVVEARGVRPGRIDAQNSGTTLRLATAIAALGDGTSHLTGDASLVKRPMGPLVDALGQLGVEARCLGDAGRPPVEVTGPLRGGTASIAGDISSQFVSALLLAGTAAEDGVDVVLTSPLASAPYVDLTLRMVRAAGGRIARTKDGFQARPGYATRPTIPVTGDYSSAAFILGAAAITSGDVTVTALPEDSGQADEAFLEHLLAFGANVTRHGDTVRVRGGRLTGTEIDLADSPDLFPILCAVATAAKGTTTLHGAPHLRFKESDRIQAMVDGLTALGGRIQGRDDGAVVHEGRITGGTAKTHGDHRIQMALAVAGLVGTGPVTLDGADAFNVSFPRFPSVMHALGADVEGPA